MRQLLQHNVPQSCPTEIPECCQVPKSLNVASFSMAENPPAIVVQSSSHVLRVNIYAVLSVSCAKHGQLAQTQACSMHPKKRLSGTLWCGKIVKRSSPFAHHTLGNVAHWCRLHRLQMCDSAPTLLRNLACMVSCHHSPDLVVATRASSDSRKPKAWTDARAYQGVSCQHGLVHRICLLGV